MRTLSLAHDGDEISGISRPSVFRLDEALDIDADVSETMQRLDGPRDSLLFVQEDACQRSWPSIIPRSETRDSPSNRPITEVLDPRSLEVRYEM